MRMCAQAFQYSPAASVVGSAALLPAGTTARHASTSWRDAIAHRHPAARSVRRAPSRQDTHQSRAGTFCWNRCLMASHGRHWRRKRERAALLLEHVLGALAEHQGDWPVSLVTGLYVFGSFARGALEPHDVDR